MSSNLPPTGPPSPSEGRPEVLEQGAGSPAQRSSGKGRPGTLRRGLLVGGGVLGLALVGGGVWAAVSFFGTGAQPAEALPADTLGYASIDLDPSGGQKIEALRTLNKFPAFEDKVGIGADDDLRRAIFERLRDETDCAGLDYEDDVEPWLGDRAAVAAVPTGDDQPSPVFVLQVKDADRAEDGLSTLRACGGGGAPAGGWSISGDWAVVAESEEIADEVGADAAESSLADDETYQRWTGAAGDSGVVTLYAGPGAGAYFADHVDELGLGGAGDLTGLTGGPSTPSELPDEVRSGLADFPGMAGIVRFSDGAVELEAAGGPGLGKATSATSDRGGEAISSLPADTVAALGIGFSDDWLSSLLETMGPYLGESASGDDLLAELSRETGLDLPQDAETLLGRSAALGLGSGLDLDSLFASPDGSASLPVALKVRGDVDEIQGVLDKLTALLPADATGLLESDSDDDAIVIGPGDDYREKALADGGLGDEDAFRDVIREADRASAILYLNLDELDGLTRGILGGGDDEVSANLEPLSAFGISVWSEDDVSHTVLRLTTD